MNEEYLIGLFRKGLIEAKADRLVALGYAVASGSAPPGPYVSMIEHMENLLRDEKALRRVAKAVIEAAK